MKRSSLLWLAACTLAFAALPAGAALYKWNDENGRVVYGDTPPAGVKAERVNPSVAPADPNAVRDMAAKDAQINKRQQDRAEEETKAEKAQADAHRQRSFRQSNPKRFANQCPKKYLANSEPNRSAMIFAILATSRSQSNC
jgi:hypothetical protein